MKSAVIYGRTFHSLPGDNEIVHKSVINPLAVQRGGVKPLRSVTTSRDGSNNGTGSDLLVVSISVSK